MAIEWPRGCQEYDGERRYNGRANIYPYHVNTRLRKNVNNMISSCNIMAQRGKRETNEKECVVLCERKSKICETTFCPINIGVNIIVHFKENWNLSQIWYQTFSPSHAMCRRFSLLTGLQQGNKLKMGNFNCILFQNKLISCCRNLCLILWDLFFITLINFK